MILPSELPKLEVVLHSNLKSCRQHLLEQIAEAVHLMARNGNMQGVGILQAGSLDEQ